MTFWACLKSNGYLEETGLDDTAIGLIICIEIFRSCKANCCRGWNVWACAGPRADNDYDTIRQCRTEDRGCDAQLLFGKATLRIK